MHKKEEKEEVDYSTWFPDGDKSKMVTINKGDMVHPLQAESSFATLFP